MEPMGDISVYDNKGAAAAGATAKDPFNMGKCHSLINCCFLRLGNALRRKNDADDVQLAKKLTVVTPV